MNHDGTYWIALSDFPTSLSSSSIGPQDIPLVFVYGIAGGGIPGILFLLKFYAF